jgi:hypothetical protein
VPDAACFQGQVRRLLVPPKIANSSTAPTVATTIDGTLKPSSYRKPKKARKVEAAQEGTDDADQEIGEQATAPTGNPLGEPPGDPADQDTVVAPARRTFEMLHAWLCGR